MRLDVYSAKKKKKKNMPSEEFPLTCKIKQGCVLTSMLFSYLVKFFTNFLLTIYKLTSDIDMMEDITTLVDFDLVV